MEDQYVMGFFHPIRRDIRNLSHSRLHILNCPYLAGLEWAFADRKDYPPLPVPPWLIGGQAVHFKIDQLLQKTAVVGKTLPLEEVDNEVEKARTHLWLSLRGKIPPNSFNNRDLRSIYWMSEEELAKKSPQVLEKYIAGRIAKYINQHMSAFRAIALRCAIPSPFVKTEAEVKFELSLDSPRYRDVKIPVQGMIDVVEQVRPSRKYPQGGWIIRDWKTGSFSYFRQEGLEGNDQMLIYWLAIRQMYGAYPLAGYFQSLSIPAEEINVQGAAVLESSRFQAQAMIRPEEHLSELIKLYDDIWMMLKLLADPPYSSIDQKLRDAWIPSSAIGLRAGLKKAVEQNRLYPKIGNWCNICPGLPRCLADNPEDWEEFGGKQRLSSVVNPEPPVFSSDDWLDQSPEDGQPSSGQEAEEEVQPQGPEQYLLFEKNKMRQPTPLSRYSFKAKDWEAYGFFTPQKLVALKRRMAQIIPVTPSGQMCPCKRTERVFPFTDEEARRFDEERENHKCAQEAQGKKRSGKGDEKVKEIYDSEIVRQAIKRCPIPGCPHAEKPQPPAEEPSTKEYREEDWL